MADAQPPPDAEAFARLIAADIAKLGAAAPSVRKGLIDVWTLWAKPKLDAIDQAEALTVIEALPFVGPVLKLFGGAAKLADSIVATVDQTIQILVNEATS